MKDKCHKLSKEVDTHRNQKLKNQIDLRLTCYSFQKNPLENWKVVSQKSFQKWVKQKQVYNCQQFPSHHFLDRHYVLQIFRSFADIVKYTQMQLSRGVLKKRRSENMQQSYRRTAMPKCDFDKVWKQLYWNPTAAWMFSCKFAVYSQNTF